MEQLKLEEIVGYLPYGINLKFVSKNSVDRLSQNDIVLFKEVDEGFICVNRYKTNNKSYLPILRPLSDLTKEIEFIIDCKKWNTKAIDYISTSMKDSQKIMRMVVNKIPLDNLEYWKIKRLYELHFDIHNLIERGLAIDYNTIVTKP